MRYLVMGSLAAFGVAALVTGWIWFTAALTRGDKFDHMPRPVRPLLGGFGLLLCALGGAGVFAVIDMMGGHQ